jgi:hypothetical protein
VKLLHYSLAASAVWLCACTVPPSPLAPSAIATVDALMSGDAFQPVFYQAFLQNGYERPDRLEPIRILRGPFRIYLQTQDDIGRRIDEVSLDSTERILIDSARIWSGGTFGVTAVARGTGTREKESGWITVKWSDAGLGDRCGRSTVGLDGGFIQFSTSPACSCGKASGVYPRLVRHELGHAMGYYHTDSAGDVMYGRAIASDACDILPSAREHRHAKFAHEPR